MTGTVLPASCDGRRQRVQTGRFEWCLLCSQPEKQLTQDSNIGRELIGSGFKTPAGE
jgi:hypothetical protein